MRKTLGVMAGLCFVTHAAGCVARGVAAEALWACHVAVAVMGLGLLLGWPKLAGAGILGILVGTPAWASDVAMGAPLVPTSLATHVGGFVIAILALRAGGLPTHCWWGAWLGGAALQQICRWMTPPSLNVNAAFATYARFDAAFPSYEAYLIALGAAIAAILWLTEFVVRRTVRASDPKFWCRRKQSLCSE